MHDQPRQVTLTIDAGAGSDPLELASLTRRLRDELLQLGVEDVALVRSDSVREGARAGDVIQWGMLLVELTPSSDTLLSALVAAVHLWLVRQDRDELKAIIQSGSIKAEIPKTSPEAARALAASMSQPSAPADPAEPTADPAEPTADPAEPTSDRAG